MTRRGRFPRIESRRARLAAWVALAVCAAGCVSTPDRRIRKNPELFASFPPEVQEAVREGRVAIGYTPDMVRMALGHPQGVFTRVTATSTNEVWVYTRDRIAPSYEPRSALYWYRDARGRVRPAHTWVWTEGVRRYDEEVLRLEFEAGRLTTIEERRQPD